MRLIDADALAEEIEKDMKNGFPANENLSLYAISCIAHAPTVDVLDKIKAEINDIEEGISSYHNDRPWVFKDEVLQIIDSHIAE